MGPAKRLQQYGVGSCSSVVEDNGTIAMGKEVKISPVAILHGSLTVEIENSFLHLLRFH